MQKIELIADLKVEYKRKHSILPKVDNDRRIRMGLRTVAGSMSIVSDGQAKKEKAIVIVRTLVNGPDVFGASYQMRCHMFVREDDNLHIL